MIRGHAVEDFFVNGAHGFGGNEGPGVGGRKGLAGLLEEFAGTGGLVVHQAGKIAVGFSGEEAGFADVKTVEVFDGEVDAAEGGILGDVAEDVRELEGVAEVLGINGAPRIFATKDADADQANGAGDAPAVGTEIFGGGVVPGFDVHLNAEDDLVEKAGIELAALDESGEGGREVGVGLEGGFPVAEEAGFFTGGTGGIVGDVIHRAAEGIKGQGVLAAVAGKSPEGKGEVGFFRAGGVGELQSGIAHWRRSAVM